MHSAALQDKKHSQSDLQTQEFLQYSLDAKIYFEINEISFKFLVIIFHSALSVQQFLVDIMTVKITSGVSRMQSPMLWICHCSVVEGEIYMASKRLNLIHLPLQLRFTDLDLDHPKTYNHFITIKRIVMMHLCFFRCEQVTRHSNLIQVKIWFNVKYIHVTCVYTKKSGVILVLLHCLNIRVKFYLFYLI